MDTSGKTTTSGTETPRKLSLSPETLAGFKASLETNEDSALEVGEMRRRKREDAAKAKKQG